MFTLSRNVTKAVKTAQKLANMLHETLFIILKDGSFYLATRAERYAFNKSYRIEPTSLTIKYQNGKTV